MRRTRENPHISFSLEAPRDPKTMIEQLVEGVIGGGLLGHGLAIEGRGADDLRFSGHSADSEIPDFGEISVSQTTVGATLEVRLWCASTRRRRFLTSALAGAVAALFGVFAFGWLVVVSVPAAAALAIASDILGWRRDRRRLERRVATYVGNTAYLRGFR